MIELTDNSLVFTFPDTNPGAKLSIDMQRTLRIPDDDKTYPLPPGLGRFPLRHVDDNADRVPESWTERGGVMLPMYQSEALWLNFSSSPVPRRAAYPFLVRVAAGKINAVTGEEWSDTRPGRAIENATQDYVVVPNQPWLDGFATKKGVVRQFVAMPLGSGYSAEEQLTGQAKWGGIQIQVHPMTRSAFERRFPERDEGRQMRQQMGMQPPLPAPAGAVPVAAAAPDMALAPGGSMTQTIHEDPFDPEDWDLETRSRCFVHLANSMVWRQITGSPPPTVPFTAAEYDRAGLPWFAHYREGPAVGGSGPVAKLKSIIGVGKDKGENPLPENESVEASKVIELGDPRPVREW